ncbi:MAG: response regulator, partial [Alphaproteobacteria bacterium]|nr:response regulator [Alphaproteobacteria bacterium]
KVDLMLVDFAMPGMNGAELAQIVRTLRPEIPVVFATGYVGRGEHVAEIRTETTVNKPYRREELAAKIAAALGRRSPASSNVLPLRPPAAKT